VTLGAYLCTRHRKVAKGWRLLCEKCFEKTKDTAVEAELDMKEGT
jgi:hypothetical protein